MSVLDLPWFRDDEAARARLEAIVWPNGPVCPHCGETGRIYALKGARTRPGLRKCGACRKQFIVTVGTVFESSHVPLRKWFQAAYLMAASKKGISSHQLMRTLEVTYRTAWFMTHRLREAMRVLRLAPLGGDGKAVEADETFIGRKEGRKKARGYAHKEAVLSLVERGGAVRSRHVPDVKAATLRPILKAQIERDTMLMTDDAGQYRGMGRDFRHHFTVAHSTGEYARGGAHTNTVEGFFSLLKRGIYGVYHHCSSHHLHRYLAEFDFRYNARKIGDAERTTRMLAGIVGKRLTYMDSSRAAAAADAPPRR